MNKILKSAARITGEIIFGLLIFMLLFSVSFILFVIFSILGIGY